MIERRFGDSGAHHIDAVECRFGVDFGGVARKGETVVSDIQIEMFGHFVFVDDAADVADEGAVVPALWRLEVANSLTVAVRRGRIDLGFRRAALGDLGVPDITTDQRTDSSAWSETLNLADRFRLTVYDAAYLELAQRRGLPLATLDDELGTAAAR